jgi:predicted DNA-binding transcriptional regulator AlpA
MKAIFATNQTTINSSNPAEQVANAIPSYSLIKKKELAKRLSVSTRTIDEWVRKRMIPYLHISPRFYLYDYDAVLASLRKQYQVDSQT